LLVIDKSIEHKRPAHDGVLIGLWNFRMLANSRHFYMTETG